MPTAPSSSAPAATPTRAVTCSRARLLISSTLIPALTRPTVRPPDRTGATARTEGPSVPVYVSVKVRPRSAGSMCPWKRRPIWPGSGWVQRMPSVSMIVTKSTSASRMTRTAYGWSRADGSAVPIAAATDGESASVSATDLACRPAASSACPRSLR
ncbi:hypothetical protein SFUMM280S_05305 [Streptomyces fumanus]